MEQKSALGSELIFLLILSKSSNFSERTQSVEPQIIWLRSPSPEPAITKVSTGGRWAFWFTRWWSESRHSVGRPLPKSTMLLLSINSNFPEASILPPSNHCKKKMGKHFSVFRDLVKKLLEVDRTQRIGCMKNGTQDVKEHKWFEKVNWDDTLHLRVEVNLRKQEMLLSKIWFQPPIIPTLYHAGDTGNFDDYEEESTSGPICSQRDRDLFAEWWTFPNSPDIDENVAFLPTVPMVYSSL